MLEDVFGVLSELFVSLGALVGGGEFDELDLLELVLADHAADVAAVGAGLGAEAGGVGAEGDGKGGFVEGFVTEEVGDGDFGGGDEPVVVFLEVAGGVWAFVVAVEEVCREFGELAGAEEGFAIDEGGGEDFGVAVLAGVEVEHEVCEGAFEAGTGAVVDDEAGAGDFCGAVEVEDVEGFAEFPVGFGGEVEGGWVAVGLDELIGVFVGADGDVCGGEVGESFEDGAEFGVGCGGFGFEGLGLFAQGVYLGGEIGGVVAGAFAFADLFGEAVALGFEGLDFGDGVAAAAIEFCEVLKQAVCLGIPCTQSGFDGGQVRPHIG